MYLEPYGARYAGRYAESEGQHGLHVGMDVKMDVGMGVARCEWLSVQSSVELCAERYAGMCEALREEVYGVLLPECCVWWAELRVVQCVSLHYYGV